MTFAARVKECIRNQTDPHLMYPIQKWGCRVMSLLAIPQFVTGRCLSPEQIHSIVDRGKAHLGLVGGQRVRTVIVNDMMKCGRDEHLLINWAFEELHEMRAGRQTAWNEKMLKDRDWQYMICQWETDGQDGHFTLFDKRDKEIYDPHDPVQAGYEVNKKRIIKRLGYATWELT